MTPEWWAKRRAASEPQTLEARKEAKFNKDVELVLKMLESGPKTTTQLREALQMERNAFMYFIGKVPGVKSKKIKKQFLYASVP